MIRFGPSGNSEEFYEQGYRHTHEAMNWLKEQGLDAYEYSFGRGVRMQEETAGRIRDEAVLHGIALSVHAPYYINLATRKKDFVEKNTGYLLATARAARAMGAKRIVLHPGSCAGLNRNDAFDTAKRALSENLSILDEEGFGDLVLCPETMGKLNQIGTLPEVIALCRTDDRLLPTVDFGHLYARSLGGVNTREDYEEILDAVGNGLGMERLLRLHCHFSKIEYTQQGEKRHLTFDTEEYGPDHMPLLRLFAQRKLSPIVICESRGTMARDARTLKEAYEKIMKEEEPSD